MSIHEQSKDISPLVDGAAILAMLTAVLYCTSAAYNGGYLLTLGLDQDVLSRESPAILYEGFIHALAALLCLLALSLILMAVLNWVHGIRSLQTPSLKSVDQFKCRILRKLRLNVLKQRRVRRRFSARKLMQERWIDRIGCLAASIVVFVCFLAWTEYQGKTKAAGLLAMVEKGNFSSFDVIDIEIEGRHKSLISLYCGAKSCAGMEPDTKKIVYFSLEGRTFTVTKAAKITK